MKNKLKVCKNCGSPYPAKSREYFCSLDCKFSWIYSASEIVDGCIEWSWTVRPDGYGRFAFRETQGLAHRFSYEKFIGPIPDGMHVCHKCDNKSCVNPDHFFLGTQADNMDDKVSKLRQNRGETHGRVKLSEVEVLQIKDILKSRAMTGRAIAKAYNVSAPLVCLIKSGKLWSHL